MNNHLSYSYISIIRDKLHNKVLIFFVKRIMAEANDVSSDCNANVTVPIPLNERIYRSKSASNVASTAFSSTFPSHSVEKKDVNDLQVSKILHDSYYYSSFFYCIQRTQIFFMYVNSNGI